MADAVSVATAKAVVERIQAATLSQQFTLERSYAEWDLELTKLDLLELRESDKLRIDVVAHTTEQETALQTRGGVRYKIPVDIAIRKKFGPDKQNDDTGRIEVEEVDALILLLQEVHLLFVKQRLGDTNLSVWDGENGGTQILAAPIREHLRTLRQFTGLIRIVFRADVTL